MTDERGTALIARLDAAQARLTALAAGPLPHGDTQPSEGGEDTWTATQVWGHLSEFPAYWTAAAKHVLAAPAEAPDTFGRRTDDPTRVTPIAGAAVVPVSELYGRCVAGIAEARAFIATLSGADWDRIGVHVTKGEVPVSGIMESMVAHHVEEHAAQLELLAPEG